MDQDPAFLFVAPSRDALGGWNRDVALDMVTRHAEGLLEGLRSEGDHDAARKAFHDGLGVKKATAVAGCRQGLVSDAYDAWRIMANLDLATRYGAGIDVVPRDDVTTMHVDAVTAGRIKAVRCYT